METLSTLTSHNPSTGVKVFVITIRCPVQSHKKIFKERKVIALASESVQTAFSFAAALSSGLSFNRTALVSSRECLGKGC
jgi:hypothetical protein